MALYSISNAVFVNGQLTSGTWSPSTPTPITTGRETSKNKFQVYPYYVNDVEGTAQFVELTITETKEWVALTETAAAIMQAGADGVALNETDDKVTTGRMRETDRVIKAYSFELTVQTKVERLVSWAAGPPEEDEA